MEQKGGGFQVVFRVASSKEIRNPIAYIFHDFFINSIQNRRDGSGRNGVCKGFGNVENLGSGSGESSKEDDDKMHPIKNFLKGVKSDKVCFKNRKSAVYVYSSMRERLSGQNGTRRNSGKRSSSFFVLVGSFLCIRSRGNYPIQLVRKSCWKLILLPSTSLDKNYQ